MERAEMVGKVLVVDDEPNVRSVISKALQKEGYEVYPAEDGREALEMLKRRGFDLTFLDILMPKIAGEEVLARMREMKPEMPVIVLTAIHDSVTEHQLIDAGASAYLKKPCSLDDVVGAANRVLNRQQTKSSN